MTRADALWLFPLLALIAWGIGVAFERMHRWANRRAVRAELLNQSERAWLERAVRLGDRRHL